MSKYEIVEVDSGEYAVRTKPNWFFKFMGWYTDHSFNFIGATYSSLNSDCVTKHIRDAIFLRKRLEDNDYQTDLDKLKE